MPTIFCDVVLLPEPQIAERAIATSRQLGESHPAQFTLQKDTYVPHLSLYITKLSADDLTQAASLLQDIARNFHPQTIEATRYHQVVGYIDVEYARSSALEALQAAVVGAINPIRAGMMEYEASQLSKTTGVAHENIRRYGYRAIGELFRPHLTFTRLVDERPVNLDGLPKSDNFSGKYHKLALFEVDANAACIRKMVEFGL